MISIAVDFDGTLCADKFPEIGRPYYNIIHTLVLLRRLGVKLVLWTCRKNDQHGNHLDEAVEWCKQFGLEFDAVNQNLPEVQAKWGGDTRKVMTTYYLDDKNMGASFEEAYKELDRIYVKLKTQGN